MHQCAVSSIQLHYSEKNRHETSHPYSLLSYACAQYAHS